MKCPRCNGAMWRAWDQAFGGYSNCVTCGFIRYDQPIDNSEEPPKSKRRPTINGMKI